MNAIGSRVVRMRWPREAWRLPSMLTSSRNFVLAPARGELTRAALAPDGMSARGMFRARCTAPWLLLAVLLGLALAGCKTLPPAPPETAPWDVRKAALQARDQFELKGRIAVAVAQEGFNAKLRWQQHGKRSDLALDGPLGVGGVRITSNGDSLKVVNSHGEQLDSEAAKQEIESRLGFEPPIPSLRYWVLGVPDPSSPADETLNDSKRLATLKQDGWQIDYTAYADVNGQALPSKATLTREGVRVRLFVDDWGG